jgi:hypothetical protein
MKCYLRVHERQFPIKCDEADGKLDVAIKQDRYVYELRL